MKEVQIYTDGACSGNPGKGGYGAILIYEQHKKEISGFEEQTTNNRMEIMAVIKALEMLKECCNVSIYSDSQYTVDAFLKNWIISWQKNGWKTSSGSTVKNIDLWERLIKLVSGHKVQWIKVKGHSDNELNNRCDELARMEIKKNS